jgi:hypothetical protein
MCNYCQYWRFNGDAERFYIGEGRCEHPAHPMPADPQYLCEDFHCARREDADPKLVLLHQASHQRDDVPHKSD